MGKEYVGVIENVGEMVLPTISHGLHDIDARFHRGSRYASNYELDQSGKRLSDYEGDVLYKFNGQQYVASKMQVCERRWDDLPFLKCGGWKDVGDKPLPVEGLFPLKRPLHHR